MSENLNNSTSGWLQRRNSDWISGRNSAAVGEPILIVEDSESDVFFLLRAFGQARVKNPVYAVRSGGEAFDYLRGHGKFANRRLYPLPKIVLLDLCMPSPDGFELLNWKKQQPEMKSLLFVAMSNFGNPKSINRAYAEGATSFLSKPLDGGDIRNLIKSFDQHWCIDDEQ